MTEAQFPYGITSCPMESLIDSHMGQHEELGQHPFIASDFPLTMQDGLDPFWAAEQFNWVNEYPVKSTTPQPYPQMWYEAGLVRQDRGMKTDPTSFSLHQSIPFQTTENPPINPRPDIELATQRALFMTPSPNTLFPSPGSPPFDPHGSPDSSYASSRGWDGEAEHEDSHYKFDFGPSALDAQYQAPGQTHTVRSPHQYPRKDEECLTPLEMPDGSTRMTLNWLPVDPDAGFAIGSAMMMNEDEAAFQDVKHAFFPSTAAAWSYDP
ncbi:hypothetical protein N7447_007265 [Penicillium robsamsonii]|uniref:uncharacterized protein n=1 Tax=Penicillium robsamsonii TaxID=1792511 RepID=UPI00254688E4|nr:uncharacterized protein N7447_007265 [Penicillium robsamsonii]KAJ5824925.1 hypothetical protein N7447_007265 [Penicillium robsamsonii]